MSIEDKMTIDERRKYLKKMQERYLRRMVQAEVTCWTRWRPSPDCIAKA